MRRALGERSIGHTGTLDPLASGVLPLVLGQATRLAQFLSRADKRYDALVRLGVRTDTDDAEGRVIGAVHAGPLPTREAIEVALDGLRGTTLQQPPAYSAKKIGGRRSYQLARAAARARHADESLAGTDDASRPPADAAEPVLPSPASVTAYAIEIIGLDGPVLALHVWCSTGYYVRSLAHDLGERLGVGGHLTALRRTATAGFTLDAAATLDDIETSPARALVALVPPARMLPDVPALTLAGDDLRRVRHGMAIAHVQPGQHGSSPLWRLLDDDGRLVAMARPGTSPGTLHPFVVLK